MTLFQLSPVTNSPTIDRAIPLPTNIHTIIQPLRVLCPRVSWEAGPYHVFESPTFQSTDVFNLSPEITDSDVIMALGMGEVAVVELFVKLYSPLWNS